MFDLCLTRNKKPQCLLGFQGHLGGPERIRTAVAAFAELSLATRPQDLLFTEALAKVNCILDLRF
jgi:hypothetical protein